MLHAKTGEVKSGWTAENNGQLIAENIKRLVTALCFSSPVLPSCCKPSWANWCALDAGEEEATQGMCERGWWDC